MESLQGEPTGDESLYDVAAIAGTDFSTLPPGVGEPGRIEDVLFQDRPILFWSETEPPKMTGPELHYFEIPAPWEAER